MPRSVKVSALLTFGLAILLFPFFEVCKRAPALSLVNAFAEDPYDAVFIGAECGGVLLGYALFAKPLGLFRPDSRP